MLCSLSALQYQMIKIWTIRTLIHNIREHVFLFSIVCVQPVSCAEDRNVIKCSINQKVQVL